MIEIFPASKLQVASSAASEQLLVCVRGEKGTVLYITELAKYLKVRSSRRAPIKPAHRKLAATLNRRTHRQ